MGQAKRRGSQAERVKQAKERIEKLGPEKLTCNNCQADIFEIESIKTSSADWPGIAAVFAGQCPACGNMTMAIDGSPEAQRDFAQAAQEFVGHSGPLINQTQRLKN